jgi:hypothetical protein
MRAGVQRRKTHFIAIPLLSAPTATGRIDNTGTTPTAARVFRHDDFLIWYEFSLLVSFVGQSNHRACAIERV